MRAKENQLHFAKEILEVSIKKKKKKRARENYNFWAEK